MKSSFTAVAISLALATVQHQVSAQTSTTGNTDSPYIPSSGISSQCSSFLKDLDSNPELASCSQNLLSATELFDPSSGSNSDSSSNSVQSTLSKLCSSSSSSQCSKSLITQHLTYFTGNCSAELAANQPIVKSNYDVLYVLYPFTKAVCSKDSKTGAYCALEVSDEDTVESASSSSASSPSPSSSGNGTVFSNDSGASNTTTSNAAGLFIQAPHITLGNLYMHVADATKNAMSRFRAKRQQSPGSSSVPSTGPANSTSDDNNNDEAAAASTVTAENALLPNATTFRSTNLPFLFLSGEMGQAQLCTDCTKEILASYVAFETDYPYGTGLASSPILGAQAKLWNDIGKVCGSGFLSAITAQSGNNISAAGKSVSVSIAVLLAGLAGFAVLF